MEKKKRAKMVERDEPYFTEGSNAQTPQQEDEVMVKDDFVILTPKEAKRKRPLPIHPAEVPTSESAPIPDEEEIIASEDELPEPIDESDIDDADVPDEEKDYEFEEVEEEQPQAPPTPRGPVLAPGSPPPPMYPRRHHQPYHSPASEQISGMPFLSQVSDEGGKSSVGGIILLLAGIAVVGGIIYYLKRNS
jgi:hypothetical protein